MLDSERIETRKEIQKLTQEFFYGDYRNYYAEFCIYLDEKYPSILGIKASTVLKEINPVGWDFDENFKIFHKEVIHANISAKVAVLEECLIEAEKKEV